MVAKSKRCFIGYFHDKSSRACHLYIMDFLETFTTGRYQRDNENPENISL